MATIEVEDPAELLHSADAEEGGLSEPGMLTEVGLLMSEVEMLMSAAGRRPHLSTRLALAEHRNRCLRGKSFLQDSCALSPTGKITE